MKVVLLRGSWLTANEVDLALQQAPGPSLDETGHLHVTALAGCSPMVDAIVRLLCFCNQSAVAGRKVTLDLSECPGAVGYIDRIGFFDRLDEAVEVVSGRPQHSAASIHKGGNEGVVEIEPINRNLCDPMLPDE